MISVIICSANKAALQRVKANIAATIGVPYEVIAIDNTSGAYGICRAYNEGGARAQFPLLCFMHEDVAFETADWGKLVSRHLSQKRTGLIGVAGGDAKSRVPTSWSVPLLSNEIFLHQHYKKEAKPVEKILVTNASHEGVRKKVVALDGVWLCTRKDVFQKFRFDEKTFPGFHGYDLDFSLQVQTAFDLYVVFDILIHHYSEGTPDRRWVQSAVALSRKWKRRLPVSVYPATPAQYNLHHWQALQVFLQKLFELRYPVPVIVYYYLRYSFSPFFTVRRFLSMGKYVGSMLFQKPISAAPPQAVATRAEESVA